MDVWVVSSLKLLQIVLLLACLFVSFGKQKYSYRGGINLGIKSLDPKIYVRLLGSFPKKYQFIFTSARCKNSD